MNWKWLSIEEMTAASPLPAGYRYALLRRDAIAGLIEFLKTWFPDIAVGAASCYLREAFYEKKVFLDGESEKDIAVILVRKGDELAAMFSAERNADTLSLYGRLGAVAGEHRGQHLTESVVALTEILGRAMGIGMIYGMATLKIPNMQRALEKQGYQLIGITPGFDREMVAPGVVKRVYEAVYAKVLVNETDLLAPDPANLAPQTKALFDSLFNAQREAHG